MSTSSRRILTVTVAAIIAVLTGVLVGLLSARSSCHPALAAEPTAGPTALTPAPTASAAAGIEPAKVPVAVCGARDTFEAVPALAALGGAGLAGLAVVVLMLVGGSAGGTAGGTAATTPSPAGRGQQRVEADRAALVRACIYVRDRITSKALADRLGAALQEAGISAVEPAGEPFDPAHHEAGGATPSDDPGKVGTIAAVEVPGYSDRGRVLRAPVVTVYQASGKRSGPRHAEREDQ